MDTAIPLQFRPTIIIFVGAPGEVTRDRGAITTSTRPQRQRESFAPSSLKSVYEHFCDLVAIEPVLQRSVGLLTIQENGNDATERTSGKPQGNSAHLDKLLVKVLHEVQGFRRVREIEDAGYPVYMKHPQLYIVGCVDSKKVSEVARCVNEQLGEERAHALISYVLLDKPITPSQRTTSSAQLSPPWMKDLLPQGDSISLVNFCYIYQEMGQPLLYMEEQDIQYAVAEALFGFLATGMTAAPAFTAATAPSLTIDSTNERIGSLGTSLIMFPRMHVESYCIDMHGVELANDWVKSTDLSSEQREALKRQIHKWVEEDVEHICDHLSDNAPRPGFNERTWPSLAFLVDSPLKDQLREETEQIFHTFMEFKQQGADLIDDEAKSAFCSWIDTLVKVWNQDVASALKRRVSERVDEIGLHSAQGIATARMYAEHLTSALGEVYTGFGGWSKKHRKSYEEALQVLQERGQGHWIPQRNIANDRAGSTQGFPGIADSSVVGMSGTPPAAAIAQVQKQGRTDNMPVREREIVENLQKRVEWLQVRIPTIAILIVVSVMAMIPLIWLLLTLLPSAWVSKPLLVGVIVTCSASLSAAGAWLYRSWSKQRVHAAMEDLTHAYCLYFAYQCECQEDTLRAEVLEALIQRLKEVCLQLANVEKDLKEIVVALQKSAENTEKNLFGSPSSYRDVFVGNKEILSKKGYSLADFNQEIVDLRQAAPKKEWHQTASRIHERLGAFLIEQNCSLIDITRDKLKEYIRQFTRMIVVPYLERNPADISAALRSHGKFILGKVLENAQVLYRPYQNIPELSYYICGSDEQRHALSEDALPPNTTMICTSNPDWLLLTCFWTGGARTRWRADTARKQPLVRELSKRPSWS
ncbi:MAG: hypothetical protein ACJ8DI_29300 [Ktedonobacteraceae bacterium]